MPVSRREHPEPSTENLSDEVYHEILWDLTTLAAAGIQSELKKITGVEDSVIREINSTIDDASKRIAKEALLKVPDRDRNKLGEVYIDLVDLFVYDYVNSEEWRTIRPIRPNDAPSAAFKAKTSPELSVPQDGKPVPYPGKRKAGDVRKFLIASYPRREGAERLTLSWLQHNDPKTYTALYTQSDDETGPPSSFLPSLSSEGDELLRRYGIDPDTPEGFEEARKLHSILTSRLQPKRRKQKTL